MSVAGWVVAAWLAGALALVMADAPGRWRVDEIAAVALWPVTVPLGYVVRRWRRWRSTCRICGGHYGKRERLLHHMDIAHSDTPDSGRALNRRSE